MPPKLAPGLYEKLITEALDRADAHVFIARHIYGELEHSLAGLSGKADQQVELANRVLDIK